MARLLIVQVLYIVLHQFQVEQMQVHVTMMQMLRKMMVHVIMQKRIMTVMVTVQQK